MDSYPKCHICGNPVWKGTWEGSGGLCEPHLIEWAGSTACARARGDRTQRQFVDWLTTKQREHQNAGRG